MDSKIFLIFVSSGFLIALGIIFILGAVKKWKFIIDPPNYLWPFYTQALVKKIFGRKTLIIQTYFWGILSLAFGLIFLFSAIKQIFQ